MQKLLTLATAAMVLLASCTENSKGTSHAETAPADTTRQVTADEHTAAAPATGLPAVSLRDMNGNTVNLQSLRGRKVFVNLWASWCPPCRQEMPSIEKLYQAVSKEKVAFVLLSLDDRFEQAKQFAGNSGLQVPMYYPAGPLPVLFNVQAIPTTFIFDEKGELVKRIDGGENYNTRKYRSLLN